HLADFLRVGLGKGTAEDRKILREDEDPAPVNEAVARDDAVARVQLFVQAKIARAVNDQLVELLERPLVQQEIQTLAGGHLAGSVLFLNARRPAAGFGAVDTL